MFRRALRPVLMGLASLSLLLAATSPTPGQTEKEQVDQLRQLLQSLQEKIDSLESKPDKSNRRVTQIGESRQLVRKEEPEALVVRIYDLSDLFAVAPPYVAQHASDMSAETQPLFPVVPSAAAGAGFGGGGLGGGGFGGGGLGGGGVFNVGAKVPRTVEARQPQTLHQFQQLTEGNLDAARTTTDDLIEAITSTISPAEWDDVGGEGSIAKLGNALIISARPRTHEQVNALLSLLRKRWGSLRTVSVRACWLWLNEEQLEALLVKPKPPAKDDVQAYGVVDEDAWKKVIAQIEGGYRARVTCYNGQTVHVLAGGQQLFVTGMTPVVGGEAIGYQPRISMIQEGAALQVTPLAGNSAKYVVLDVHSRINLLRSGREQKPAPAGPPIVESLTEPQQVVRALDHPTVMTYRLSTTLRVPVDRTLLVGGMTGDNQQQPGQPDLCLFVRLTVQELRDEAETDSDTATQPAAQPGKQPQPPPKSEQPPPPPPKSELPPPPPPF